MKTVSDDDLLEFLMDAFSKIDDPCAPDVTFEVFKATSRLPSLKAKYKLLGGAIGSPINRRIGLLIKQTLDRKNDVEIDVDENKYFIKSYTRFLPEPCDKPHIKGR